MLNEFNFIFGNDQIHIEFDKSGIAWFYGPEIAKVLEYEHPAHMYRMLSSNEMNTVHKVDRIPSRGNPNIIMINEPGLYRCIFNSRSPRAVEFQNKVFYDILPSIRRYGAYIDPETRAQLDSNPNIIHDLNTRITELENQPKPNKQMYVLVDEHVRRHKEEINRLKGINNKLNKTNEYISNERDNYIISDRNNMKHGLELAQENRILKNKLNMIYNVVNNFQSN